MPEDSCTQEIASVAEVPGNDFNTNLFTTLYLALKAYQMQTNRHNFLAFDDSADMANPLPQGYKNKTVFHWFPPDMRKN